MRPALGRPATVDDVADLTAYFGTGDVHVPNDTDYTIVAQDGKFVKKEACFEIAALAGNPLAKIRAAEQSAK